MRPLILISALVWAGCAAETETRHPPTDRFVYPSGIAHLPVADDPAKQGSLYVASANFDKCFDMGAVLALNLDDPELGLPAIGAVGPNEPPVEITDLRIGPEASVEIESFAGQMALWNPAAGQNPRLFVPTRAEESYLHVLEIDRQAPMTLRCASGDERDCIPGALSLTSNISGAQADQPRAPAPIGVTVGEDDSVWVTHIEAADSPARTAQSFQTYVVRLPDAGAEELSLSAENFIPISSGGLSVGGAHATALGQRYSYITGRSFGAGVQTQPATFLLRLIDRANTSRILETGLGSTYQTLEARDVVLGGYNQALDRERLYIVARGPDTLLVVDVLGASSDRPSIAIVDAVLLPDGASYAKVIHRGLPGGSDDIVAVTSTASVRREGVVALYDTRLGQVVKQVDSVGRQPYGIAVHQPPGTNQARLFVTNFGDGRVAVIDIPDLDRPQGARRVAYLGSRQGRDEKQGTSTCEQQETEP